MGVVVQINGPHGQRIKVQGENPEQQDAFQPHGTITGSFSNSKPPVVEVSKEIPVPPKAQQYAEAFPEVAQWVLKNATAGNTFAQSLAKGMAKYGGLTAKQQACVEKNLHKEKNPPPKVSFGSKATSGLVALFDNAKKSGLKWPKLHLFGFVFSKAGDNSKNPGHLYVKREDDGMYMGKITPQGLLQAAYKTSNEELGKIAAIGNQPIESILAHGMNSGNCACCNSKLTDPKSLAAGIGPVCAKNWGLPWGDEKFDIQELAKKLGIAS